MKHLFSYYEIPATLVMPSEQAKPWPEWPHVYIGNMQLDERSLRAFNNHFATGKPFTARDAKRMQEALQGLWRQAEQQESVAWKPGERRPGLSPGVASLGVACRADGAIEIIAGDLFTFAYISLMSDIARGRAKICPNPDCPNPYFLKIHGRKQYCGHACASHMSVRRFRSKTVENKKGR